MKLAELNLNKTVKNITSNPSGVDTPRAQPTSGTIAVNPTLGTKDSFAHRTATTNGRKANISSFTTAPLATPRARAVHLHSPHISHRPTVIEIDSQALANNIQSIKKRIGENTLFTAVVKANGYGHGAVEVSKIALEAGADRLAVAAVDEAIELRRAGITAPIHVLGYNGPEEADDVVNYNIIATVYDIAAAKALSYAAIRKIKPVKVHVKVNSGMNRLGVSPKEAASFIKKVGTMPLIKVEGMFTHFGCVGSDQDITDRQLARFNQAISSAEAQGVRPTIVHAANSMTTLAIPEAHFDMVRCGIWIYGIEKSFGEKVLNWKTRIAHVNEVPPGEGIGYDAVYRTEEPRKIAAIPVGYGDGLPQGPKNTWRGVLVNGQFAPIRGKVCMDQTMIDVTDIDGVKPGDEVVLIGKQGDQEITIQDASKWSGRSGISLITGLSRRNRRVVIGKKVAENKVITPNFGTSAASVRKLNRSLSLGDLSPKVF